MAITYVGKTSSMQNDANASITINKPSGVLPGDVMVAFVCNFDRDPIPPSGWVAFNTQASNALVRLKGYTKVAGVSEAANYTWKANTSSSVTWGLSILAYRGVNSDDPVQNTSNQSSTTLEALAVSVTATGTDSWCVFASAMRDNGVSSSASCSSVVSPRSNDWAADTYYPFVRGLAAFDSNGAVTAGLISRTMTWSSSSLDAHAVISVILNAAPDTGGGGSSNAGDLEETPPVTEVSAKFLHAIQRSHNVMSYVDVISPTGQKARLIVEDGDIGVDRTAEVRRTCTLTCIDPTGELTPDSVLGLLTPFGTELRPYRGVVYSDVEGYETVPLGVFRISKVSITDSGGALRLGIEASDLSRTVSRDKFTAPYTIETGNNLIDAIKTISKRTFPTLSFNVLSTSRVVESTRVYDIGDDPWEAMTELATSLGFDIYFDVWGRLCILPFPDIENLPSAAFRYVEGENCTMLSLSKILSDSPGYNGVVVLGEAPSDELPAVKGEAWDDEPTSVTYRKGPYGEVPMFVTDQLVKTEQEANDTAAALLKNQLGFSSQVDLDAITNPLLECGDVVAVKRAISHVDASYVLDSFNVPLRASGTQSLTLRQKRGV